jgi:hypothetical protein
MNERNKLYELKCMKIKESCKENNKKSYKGKDK